MRSIFTSSFLAVSAAATLLAACGSSGQGSGSQDVAIAKSTKPRNVTPAVDTPTVNALESANAKFTSDLYGKIVALSPNDNVAYSPYSVSVALAMTYAGALGTTANELAKTLHVDSLDSVTAHAAYDKLDLDLNGRAAAAHPSEGHSPFELHVVNSLWATPHDQWQAAFLDTLAVDYGAGVRLTDFAANPDSARTAINGWVSDSTEAKIPQLLGPGTITPETALVLVNAMYMKASWAQGFDPAQTKDVAFHALDGSTPNVPTMSTLGRFAYASTDQFDAIVLPYDGVPMQMTIVVPKSGTFTSFESSFTGAQLDGIEASTTTADVNLELPKFDVKGSSISLRNALADLGMPTAFTVQADFSAMTTTQRLKISDVIHQAFVSVDEKGTEAAAATAVIAVGTSIEPKIVQINVDRPFLFFVRDAPTKTTLFAGRVVKPS